MDVSPIAAPPQAAGVLPPLPWSEPGSPPERSAEVQGAGVAAPAAPPADVYQPTGGRSIARPVEDRQSGNRPETDIGARNPRAGEEEATRASEGGRRAQSSGDAKESEEPGLTAEEKRQVEKLKRRDAEVRAHEQAHVMAGGRYITRRAQFEFEKGPDGKLYAVGGDVQIDTSKEDTPEATIQKAQTVRRAALAPADPSPQDHQVAAAATRMEFEARMELARQRSEEAQAKSEEYNRDGQIAIPRPGPFMLNSYA